MQSPISYIREVIAEAKHITWPTRDTLIQFSVVVIFLSFTIAVILGGFDYLMTNAIGYLTSAKTPNTIPLGSPPTPQVTLTTTIVPTINK